MELERELKNNHPAVWSEFYRELKIQAQRAGIASLEEALDGAEDPEFIGWLNDQLMKYRARLEVMSAKTDAIPHTVRIGTTTFQTGIMHPELAVAVVRAAEVAARAEGKEVML